MSLIEFCLRKPVLLTVGVVFALLAGIWSLLSLPIQLTPDIEMPRVTVRTQWPGASPYEIEREILRPQEEQLNNLPRLISMNSTARSGFGSVTLEFDIGTDINQLLPRISNQLSGVTRYPENASQPAIVLTGENSSPVVWAQLIALEGNARSIRTYKAFVEDQVIPELEKVAGVSEVRVYGGQDPELQVRFDSDRLALHGITLNELIRRLRAEHTDVSGGAINQGKRVYTVRTVSPFRTPETLGLLVLKNTDSGTVLLRDVAEVRLGHKTGGSFNISDQGPALTVNVYREAGSNLLQVTEKAQAVIEQLNSGLLKDEKLTLRVISDPSYYIHSAIDLVLENIYLGGFLAIFSLYLFLGSLRSALVIALSIPTSIITTFVFLRLTGRNINVISLAGLAFAVGMVVDASIVVLENIDTWRKKGHSRFDSLLKATKEVHNAILASSLTTVAVFLPVALVKDQAGQLFRDIALAIVFAILISYLVSTTVVPSLYRVLMDRVPDVKMQSDWLHRQVSQLHRLGRRFSDGLVAQVHWLQQTLQRKLVVVVGGTAVALLCSWALMPKMEYLPGGNQNLLLSLLFPPTGYNENELTAVGRQVVAALKPYSEGEKDGFPRIKRVFFVSFSTNALVGTVSEDPRRVAELIPLVNRVIGNVAGIRGFTNQTSLFERGMGAGRSIDLEIYGTDLFETAGVAQDLYSRVNQVLPGSQVRAVPAFELDNPELRIEPDPVRTSAAGLSTADLGLIVDIYTDGRKIDEFSLPGGRTLDVNLIPAEGGIRRLEDFESRLLLTPDNRRITIGSVARVRESVGPNQIDHLSGQRAYVLRVLPPSAMPLETALNLLDKTLLTQARNDYAHVPGLHFALTGTADAFTKTRQALDDGLILALAITFLLLVILFEDLLSPLVIMGALPIAGMGGLLALKLVNLFLADQPLDMLTLLGFMMMIGIVVNNPILIVSRALDLIREESWPLSEAIVEGVRSRLRPIFMTTTTSVFGLLPLVVKPGAGSELYRGLGAAVLGGLVLSTLVNLVFVPCLFSLFQDLQRALLPRTVEEAAHQTTEQPSFIQGD